jgi:peptide/nickel transport system permease protein
MFAYVIRRLLISIVVLFFATILVFVLVASSGNPLALLLANPHIPHTTILAREKILHLNDPLWQRYWIWFTGVLHGDFGTTIQGQDVASQAQLHPAGHAGVRPRPRAQRVRGHPDQ